MKTRWALLVVASMSLLACTVTTTRGDGGDGRSSGPAAESPSGAPPASTGSPDSPDAPTTDAPPPVSTTPAELVGPSWTWVTTYGAQSLSFAADGTYTMDVFLDAHPGDACGTEYFTRHAGRAEFASSTLVLRGTASTRTKKDSCGGGKVLAEDAVDPQAATYVWRLADDALVLTNDEGFETSYARDTP